MATGSFATAQLAALHAADTGNTARTGGELKIIAAIIEAPVIERILTHLGLAARAPRRSPARLPSLLQAA